MISAKDVTRAVIVVAGLCGAVLIGVLAVPASGEATYWQHDPATAGDWHTETNWTAGVPSASDDAYINSGTAEIASPGAASTWLYLGSTALDSGTIEMTATGSLAASWEERVGQDGTGWFVQTGGTNTTRAFNLGYNSGSSGMYELSAGDLSVSEVEFIGVWGTGLFSHTGGTNTTAALQVGYDSGPGGTYELSGEGQVWADAETLGCYNGGAGTFTQTGGTNIVSGNIVLGLRVGTSGVYTISDGVLRANSLFVGDEGNGTFSVRGGAADIELNAYVHGTYGGLVSEVDGTGLAAIQVTGQATLVGTWDVVDSGAGFATFDVLTATGGITGNFSSVLLPDADWVYWIEGDTLRVRHTPEPATLGLLALGGAALAARRRKG